MMILISILYVNGNNHKLDQGIRIDKDDIKSEKSNNNKASSSSMYGESVISETTYNLIVEQNMWKPIPLLQNPFTEFSNYQVGKYFLGR